MKYSGQALAIVLVLLLVGSIIGFALYARTVREAERTVGERAAAEANELVETIIGLVSTSDYAQLKEGFMAFVQEEGQDCEEDDLSNQGCRENNMDVDRVKSFFEDYLLMDEVDLSKFDRIEDYCLSEMAIKYITPEDDVIIQQDDAFGFFLYEADWNAAGCEVTFVMKDGDADGFTLSEFYAQHSDGDVTSYKNYVHDDIEGYLYGGSGTNWTTISDSETFVYNSSNNSKEGNSLHELRFKSLGGWSRLSWDIADSCDLETYLLMEVGSTCGDKYVGKKFIVPSDLFAPPVFDYVLFNGVGEVKPESIDPELLQ